MKDRSNLIRKYRDEEKGISFSLGQIWSILKQ